MFQSILYHDLSSIPLFVLGSTLLLITLVMGWRAWRSHRRWMLLAYGPLSIIALGILLAGSILFWYTHRPRPEPVQQMLFQGVEYIRELRDEPRPLIIHVIRVDLDAPGVEFMVTPHTPTSGRVLAARTTSEYLDEFDLQVAINGDFFAPWWSGLPWDFYPHSGDPVDVNGLSASRGDLYTRGLGTVGNTLYINAENTVSFSPPPGDIYNAITGFGRIVREGAYTPIRMRGSYVFDPHPRTAVAFDQSGETLLMIVVDGRQPNYSEGVTLAELAAIIIDYGGWEGLNLDGGGSSTLVIAGQESRPDVLNSPIHTRIPGRERPIANHLGVYALPLPD